MKLEINIDENFLKKEFYNRNISFSKILEVKLKSAALLRDKNKIRYPSFLLDNKLMGYEFAKLCGLNTPMVSEVNSSIDNISLNPGTVIKPMHGFNSNGVFVIYSENKILAVRPGNVLNSLEKIRAEGKTLLKKRYIPSDKWMVEELIFDGKNIARDVKFYCFYGKTGLILETDRENGTKRCWFDDDLNYVNTGKYTNSLFKADREKLNELKILAESISQELPVPFVRIDFLILGDKFYLGEFTPVPGQNNEFTNEWDQYLGEMYMDAVMRLTYDVSLGKEFEKYNSLPKTMLALFKKNNYKP
ncbi:ATP-grasp fold amidoligase family protein [Ignatzschineria cameli]|uniref:ATP-grasp fold amidoligase family protein n=1 Tax=Ignatzschineria cameli TaxID=2182793 RepID=UPI000D617A31|nr:ATP-grasp fold amidoligase family protein [Ignatzschineria cameli]PWD86045.1 hypothetical protein DC080_04625 [Ignatzschineria cameli]